MPIPLGKHSGERERHRLSSSVSRQQTSDELHPFRGAKGVNPSKKPDAVARLGGTQTALLF